jgi:hypothetical protein
MKELQSNGIPIHYISTCIGTASLYAMPRILKLADELGVDTFFRYLEGPKWLDPRYLPKSAKLEVIANLEKIIETAGPTWTKWLKSEIKLLNKYLETENQMHVKEFVRVMDILDQRRETNWRVTLHDIYDLIKNHCYEVDVN